MNPYLIIACMLAVAGAGYGGFELGVDHEKANQIDKKDVVDAAVKAATETSAQAIAAIKPKYTTIQGKLEKQIVENVVFRDCRLNGESLRLVNEALASPFDRTAGRVESERKQSADLPRDDAPTP